MIEHEDCCEGFAFAARNAPDTCPAIAPAHFSQAGARCEREPHGPEVNHKIAPTADKPGAVWEREGVLVPITPLDIRATSRP